MSELLRQAEHALAADHAQVITAWSRRSIIHNPYRRYTFPFHNAVGHAQKELLMEALASLEAQARLRAVFLRLIVYALVSHHTTLYDNKTE